MDGALYQATENGHEAVVQLLLKHMMHIDTKDDGQTALPERLRMGTRQRCSCY
jgi:hypothetical protein